MTCPVNVSLNGGYPDGRTRRRVQEPAEPPQVRDISVGFRQYYRDPQEIGQHVYGADLPLAEQREQEPGGIAGQRPAAGIATPVREVRSCPAAASGS